MRGGANPIFNSFTYVWMIGGAPADQGYWVPKQQRSFTVEFWYATVYLALVAPYDQTGGYMALSCYDQGNKLINITSPINPVPGYLGVGYGDNGTLYLPFYETVYPYARIPSCFKIFFQPVIKGAVAGTYQVIVTMGIRLD